MQLLKLLFAIVFVILMIAISPIFLSIYVLGQVYMAMLEKVINWALSSNTDEDSIFFNE